MLAFLCATLLVQAPASYATSTSRIDASVRSSLEATLVKVERRGGASLAAQVARLLRWKGDVVRHIHPKDKITVLFTPGETPRTPELVAVHYKGLEISLDAFRFPDSEDAEPVVYRFYDRDGQLIEPVLLDSPAAYAQITETVQGGRGKRHHQGIDLKAAEGVPVTLPFDATISRVNWSTRRNGNCLEFVYKTGERTKGRLGRFLHLTHVAEGISGGDRLKAGTIIGAVGNTGRSSAAHLHYEIRDSVGKALSPLKVHGQGIGTVPAERMQDFRAARDIQQQLLAPVAVRN